MDRRHRRSEHHMIFSRNTYLHIVKHVAGRDQGRGVRSHFYDAHLGFRGLVWLVRVEADNRSDNTRRTDGTFCVRFYPGESWLRYILRGFNTSDA